METLKISEGFGLNGIEQVKLYTTLYVLTPFISSVAKEDSPYKHLTYDMIDNILLVQQCLAAFDIEMYYTFASATKLPVVSKKRLCEAMNMLNTCIETIKAKYSNLF